MPFKANGVTRISCDADVSDGVAGCVARRGRVLGDVDQSPLELPGAFAPEELDEVCATLGFLLELHANLVHQHVLVREQRDKAGLVGAGNPALRRSLDVAPSMSALPLAFSLKAH